eukprot:jgi/Psemu1/26188/gm1.26188_g
MLRQIWDLRANKITWPDDLGKDDLRIMSVDRTHCWIAEPSHPVWSQDSNYYSHKYNKSGINYERGISLTSNKIIWMNGPFKARANDVAIFKGKGLKERLGQLKKKTIRDAGYQSHQKYCVTPNCGDFLFAPWTPEEARADVTVYDWTLDGT